MGSPGARQGCARGFQGPARGPPGARQGPAGAGQGPRLQNFIDPGRGARKGVGLNSQKPGLNFWPWPGGGAYFQKNRKSYVNYGVFRQGLIFKNEGLAF